MREKILSMVIFVFVGIVIGVAVAVQRTTNPVMIDQLTETVRSLKQVEAHLAVIEKHADTVAAFFKNVEDQNKRMQGQQRQQGPTEDYSKVYEIDPGSSPIRGKKDAPVTIVAFMDFQCPFCQRFHPPIIETLKAYPDKVRYILKNYPLPFHPQARPAAKAALAAGEQGKYYEMADLLLSSGTNLTDAHFEELAKQLGLDVEKFKKDYKEKDANWEKILNDDMALGSKVDVQGTPTFFINGRKTMARDFNSFKTEIDKILSEQPK